MKHYKETGINVFLIESPRSSLNEVIAERSCVGTDTLQKRICRSLHATCQNTSSGCISKSEEGLIVQRPSQTPQLYERSTYFDSLRQYLHAFNSNVHENPVTGPHRVTCVRRPIKRCYQIENEHHIVQVEPILSIKMTD